MENTKIVKKLFVVALLLASLFAAQSCSPEFAEGFRQGWNTTAPSQYHY